MLMSARCHMLIIYADDITPAADILRHVPAANTTGYADLFYDGCRSATLRGADAAAPYAMLMPCRAPRAIFPDILRLFRAPWLICHYTSYAVDIATPHAILREIFMMPDV